MRECARCETCYPDELMFCPKDGNQTRSTLPGSQLLARRYRLEKRLGRGAMGQVYLANDENLGTRKVAVKTVRPDLLNSEDLQEGEALARFKSEARSAASIQHPHVVAVTDFGKSELGIFYLVMEFVEGETLHHLLRREGTLNIKRAFSLMQQICEGVEAAHEAGILHRDLKPANIFLMKKKRQTEDSKDDGFIKVGDFGLAKIVNEAQKDASANQGPASRGIIGTPEFMSPEQMQPDATLDARTDVYALGTIAYMMLGGKVPFSGDLMQILTQKLMNDPPPLSSLRSDIPTEVERAVMHALSRDTLQRPATVSAWLTEFGKAVQNTTDSNQQGSTRLVIMAPVNAEVYVDDERKGSVGSSGRIILSSIPVGQHVLRVAYIGARDDERVIEIREEASEQVIQAQLRPLSTSTSQPSPTSMSVTPQTVIPGIVACTKCNARFAAGVKFCGKCGNNSFQILSESRIKVAPEMYGSSLGQGNQVQNYPPSPVSNPSNPTNQTANNNGYSNYGQQQSPQSNPQNLIGQPNAPVNPANSMSNQGADFPCPRCHSMLPPESKFCGKCGLKLFATNNNQPQQTAPNQVSVYNQNPNASFFNQPPRAVEIICRQCNTSYPPTAKFCGKCGIPLVS